MYHRLLVWSLVLLATAVAGRSSAQTTYTWSGLSPAGEFLTPGNWSANATPPTVVSNPLGTPGTYGTLNVPVDNLNVAVFGSNYSSVGLNINDPGNENNVSYTLGQIVVNGSNTLTLGSSATTAGDRYLAFRGTEPSSGSPPPSVILSAVGGDITINSRLAGANAGANLIVRLGTTNGGNIISAAADRTITINATVSEIQTGTSYGIAKQGAGTLRLSGANTYTGTTTVTNGTLLANNTTGSATGSATVTVGYDTTANTNGVLGGTGRIAGAVVVNQIGSNYGTLTAGTAADRTLETGAINLAGHYRVQLFGTATEQSSQVISSGLIELSTAASILELDLNGQTVTGLRATGAKSYTIMTGTDRTGFFSNATASGPITFAGFDPSEWAIQYNANSIVLNFTPVPEPASVLAVGATAFGLFRLSRRWVRRQPTPV